MFTHLYPSVLCDHFFIVSNRSWRQPWWLYIITVHYVQFVKYDVTVSFMAQVLDTVAYLVPQVFNT